MLSSNVNYLVTDLENDWYGSLLWLHLEQSSIATYDFVHVTCMWWPFFSSCHPNIWSNTILHDIVTCNYKYRFSMGSNCYCTECILKPIQSAGGMV